MARNRHVIPGFSLSLGYTLLYMNFLVLIPLLALVVKTTQLSWDDFKRIASDPFVVSAMRLSLQSSLAAALLNAVFGIITAWVLVRYVFPGRWFFDAIVDFPFALPTAVAGLTFGSLFARMPWVESVKIGDWLTAAWNWVMGWAPVLKLSAEALSGLNEFTVILMLTFISLPFVIRTVQPVLQEWDVEMERAAHSLGAGTWMTFRRVVFPELFPAWLSGVALAFARAVGEYGSIIFVTGNIPGKSQIVPVQIMTKLEDFKYSEATAIGVMLLAISLAVLLFINGLEWWSRRHER